MAKVASPTAGGDGLIPKDQACRLLMITPQWLNRLQANGYVPQGPRGKVSLVGAVQGYIKSLKDEERRSSKSAADSRVRDARAQEIEMRIAERKRDLIPFEDAVEILDFLIGSVREELSGLAARITRDMAMRRKIEEEIHAAQARIAEAHRTAKDVGRSGKELPYSDTDNDT